MAEDNKTCNCMPIDLTGCEECKEAPAGLRSTVYFRSLDPNVSFMKKITLESERTAKSWVNGFQTSASFEMPEDNINPRFKYKFFPKRLPRKEKKRRKERQRVTSVLFGIINESIEYAFLLHKELLIIGLPLCEAQDKIFWLQVAECLKKHPKKRIYYQL